MESHKFGFKSLLLFVLSEKFSFPYLDNSNNNICICEDWQATVYKGPLQDLAQNRNSIKHSDSDNDKNVP